MFVVKDYHKLAVASGTMRGHAALHVLNTSARETGLNLQKAG